MLKGKFEVHYGNIIRLAIALVVIILLSVSIDQLNLVPGEKAEFSAEPNYSLTPQEKPLVEAKETLDPPFWFIYFLYLPFICVLLRLLKNLSWDPIKDKSWMLYISLFTAGLLITYLIGLGVNFLDHAIVDFFSSNNFRDPRIYRDPAFQNYYSHLILALILLLLATVSLFSIRILERFARRSSKKLNISQKMMAEASKAAEHIAAGLSAREMIISCYRNMCLILETHHNIDRKSSMTASEFKSFLIKLGFDGLYITELTQLFEKARYSDLEFNQTEADQAECNLRKIADHCRGIDEA